MTFDIKTRVWYCLFWVDGYIQTVAKTCWWAASWGWR